MTLKSWSEMMTMNDEYGASGRKPDVAPGVGQAAGGAVAVPGDGRVSPAALMTFAAGDPGENPWVHGKPRTLPVQVTDYDTALPARFLAVRGDIAEALGAAALAIEHVGSTAVPGLRAKPVIDVDVIVADPEREEGYVPQLEALGYTLTVRERSWYGHRMLRHDSPEVNLHVFGPDCPEHIRHLMFRDWLREHPQDRQRYAQAKDTAKVGADNVPAYNQRKESVVRDVYAKIFASLGWLQAARESHSGQGTQVDAE